MLCEPVTYEAVKTQFVPLVWLFSQFCDRYRMAAVTVGVTACERFSTPIRFSVGFGSSSRPPHW